MTSEAHLAGSENGFDPPAEGPLLLPPRGFKGAGHPLNIQQCANPYTHRTKSSASQKAGLAYEKKAKSFLRNRFQERVTLGQWFKFYDGYRTRYCQPDAIVQDHTGIMIIEIKLRFSDLAWWQLKELYLPIVKKYYHASSCQLLVLCKSFDPNCAVCLPEIIPLIENFSPRIPDCVYAQVWRP